MKISQVAFISLATLGYASAGANKPSITVNVKDGHFDDVTGLDPSLTWSSSANAGGCDIEVGVDIAVKPTTDLQSLPRSIWGKVSRDVEGWNLSARANVEVEKLDDVDFDIKASNEDLDTSLKLQASTGGLGKIEVSKGFSALDGDLNVNPRYDAKSSIFDVILGFSKDNSGVKLQASPSNQKLTVSRQISDSDKLSPSISSSGAFSLAWERALSGGDKVTTTLNSNESLDMKWEDGPWLAKISAPLDGYRLGEGVDVSIKRKVDFF